MGGDVSQSWLYNQRVFKEIHVGKWNCRNKLTGKWKKKSQSVDVSTLLLNIYVEKSPCSIILFFLGAVFVYKISLFSAEIGAHFRAEDFVEYEFTAPISTVAERIRVGFVTSEPRGILLQVNGATGDYLTIEMSNAGTVRVAFDLGFERQEIYEESEYYPNGQFHDVTVWRTDAGRTVNIQVRELGSISRLIVWLFNW